MKKYYMHLVNGEPAIFDGEQIVKGLPNIKFKDLKSTLYYIRLEQNLTAGYRRKKGFWKEGEEEDYSYLKVYLPEEKDHIKEFLNKLTFDVYDKEKGYGVSFKEINKKLNELNQEQKEK